MGQCGVLSVNWHGNLKALPPGDRKNGLGWHPDDEARPYSRFGKCPTRFLLLHCTNVATALDLRFTHCSEQVFTTVAPDHPD